MFENRTALNGSNVYVLYAQTDTFNITGDACTDPTTSASCYAPASTVYVTQTGESSRSPSLLLPVILVSEICSADLPDQYSLDYLVGHCDCFRHQARRCGSVHDCLPHGDQGSGCRVSRSRCLHLSEACLCRGPDVS